MTKAQFNLISWIVTGIGSLAIVGALVNHFGKTPREKVVDYALGEVGDQDPDKFWSVVQPEMVGSGAAWCGAFALWALRQAGLLPTLDWAQGRGFIFRANKGKMLPTTRDPKPGDIAYFNHLQHHAIVKEYDGKTLVTIDGNQGPGEQVTVRTRNPNEVTAFFSIEPLLENV